ncbi:hypothetical protein ONZ43_g3454 [Nemania bipapillata]|uniref:Uncharacterized protein n=1 Tax=Nemania bipapillata TaxID=110536 RepID=A0ACC2IWS9_9PEZI|nr:hypothetical protein ONZ43_g3454 [Nemania bipapillata]
MMDAAGSINSAGKKAAVKLMPKKFAVAGRWTRKQPSNESFGSLASTENEEYPRGRRPSTRGESEQGVSKPGSLSTTRSTSDELTVNDDDDNNNSKNQNNDNDNEDTAGGVKTGSAEHGTARGPKHEEL